MKLWLRKDAPGTDGQDCKRRYAFELTGRPPLRRTAKAGPPTSTPLETDLWPDFVTMEMIQAGGGSVAAAAASLPAVFARPPACVDCVRYAVYCVGDAGGGAAGMVFLGIAWQPAWIHQAVLAWPRALEEEGAVLNERVLELGMRAAEVLDASMRRPDASAEAVRAINAAGYAMLHPALPSSVQELAAWCSNLTTGVRALLDSDPVLAIGLGLLGY